VRRVTGGSSRFASGYTTSIPRVIVNIVLRFRSGQAMAHIHLERRWGFKANGAQQLDAREVFAGFRFRGR